MYVCICNAVTDTAINAAIDEGVRSFRDLSYKTGCATQCGSCVSTVREVMDRALQSRGLVASGGNLQVVSSGYSQG